MHKKMKNLEGIIKRKILPIVISSTILLSSPTSPAKASSFEEEFMKKMENFYDQCLDVGKKVFEDGKEFANEARKKYFGETEKEKLVRMIKEGRQDEILDMIKKGELNYKIYGIVNEGVIPLNDESETKIGGKKVYYINHNEIEDDGEYKKCKSKIYDKESIFRDMSYLEAIEYVKTPDQAQNYLDRHLCYGIKIKGGINFSGKDLSPHIIKEACYNSLGAKNSHTFREIHENGVGLCGEYARAAAALLLDDGYPPQIMKLFREGKKADHEVYLFQAEDGRYAAIGNDTDPGFKYNTIEELVKDIGYDSYKIYTIGDGSNNLDQYWITGENKKMMKKLKGSK